MWRLSRLAIDTKILPLVGSDPKAPAWALENAVPKSESSPITSPVDFISGPSTVSTWRPSRVRNRLNGITASLTAIGWSAGSEPPSPVAGQYAGSPELRDRLPHHHPRRGLGQRDRGRLRDERDGPARPRVGLEHVEHVGAERVLDVEQPQHADAASDRLGRLPDPLDLGCAERDRRQDACGVAGVDAGLLDVLHHAAEEELLAVVQRVDVDLDCVVDEPVDEHWVLRADLGRPLDVALQRLVVVDDLHAAPAEHVRRPHQHGVADLLGDPLGVGEAGSHAVLRRRQPSLGQHPPEGAALLREVDRLGGGADDGHTVVLEPLRQAQRASGRRAGR